MKYDKIPVVENLSISVLTAQAAHVLAQISGELKRSYNLLTEGGLLGQKARRPSQIVAEALDAHGGVVCALLYAYREENASAADLPFLKTLSDGFEGVYVIAKDAARRIGQVAKSGVTYVQRFFFQPLRFFQIDYMAKVQSKVLTVEQARARISSHVSKAVRQFWEWLYRALCALESRLAPDPMRPVEILAYARRVVDQADRKKGLFVLKAVSTEGSQPFSIRPGSNKAWEILRLLCGSTDPEGYVALPRDYAKAFHRTDNDNETIHDDYERLVRHIVPGSRKGHYRLELAEKPPLVRGA